jgi:two-component system response regulator MtrA
VDRPAVLVIEDEPAIRTGLCDVLAFHGLAPTAAADGTTGLRLGLDGQWALAIVDVMLPGVDGFTITRALRERHPSLPC